MSTTDAWRATRAKSSELLWRDHRGIAVGLASVAWLGEEALAFAYRVEDLAYSRAAQGELRLGLVWKGSLDSNRQPYALCPGCQRPVALMVLRDGAWRCSGCHALENRSRLLASDVRNTEKAEDLQLRIEAVAWSGGDVTPLVEAFDELIEKVDERPIGANSLYTARVDGEWLHPPLGAAIL